MQEFSLMLGNEPGALSEIAQALGEQQVNIEGIAALTVLDEGVVSLVTDNPDKTRKTLRSLNQDFEEREAVVLSLSHQPGQLASLLTRLSDEAINVLSCYWTVEKNQIVITVDRVERAKEILRIP